MNRNHAFWTALLFVATFPQYAHTAQQTDDELIARTEAEEETLEELERLVITAERAVTATKTETKLTETPQSVSVVPAALFHDRGALNLQEVMRYASGVTAEAFGLDTRAENIFVRGLVADEYWDGLRKTFNFNPLPRTDVYALERVEVLRGPSSVLYGQGGSGGIVNAIGKRPRFSPEGHAAVEYGSFDHQQAMFDYTSPLNAAGTMAGRVTLLARDAGQQTDKIDDDRLLLQPSFSWRPGDRTEITLTALYQRDRNASSQQFLPVVATLEAPPGRRVPLETFLGDEDFDRLNADQTTGTLEIRHRINRSFSLRSTTRYIDADTKFLEIYPDVYTNPEHPFIDDDARMLNRVAYGTAPHMKILTTDNAAELDFSTGVFEHRLLTGLDYTNFRQRSSSAFGAVTPIDLYDPVSEGVVFPEFARDPNQRNTQLGAYLQDQIQYAGWLTLVAGVRHDRADSKTQGAPSQTDEKTSWRFGVIAEFVPGFAPYLSYSQSFRPVEGLTFDNEALKPIVGEQWEGGVKWQPHPGLLLTAAAYHIEERNQPINDPENVLGVVQIGKVRSRGVELEGSFELPREFMLTAAASYNEAEVTESLFEFEVGEQLNDVPKKLASLWLMKNFHLADAQALRFGLGGRYVGETQSVGVAGRVETPSYTLADAMAGYEFGDWTLAVTATNLFDKTYFAPCRAFGDCFTGNRRRIIGKLSYRW